MNRSLFMEIMIYKMDLSQTAIYNKNLTTIEPVTVIIINQFKNRKDKP